jgi:class 3 adenylate cyclase
MSDPSINTLLDEAHRTQRTGDFEKALALYREAAAHNSPEALDARLRLGKLLVLLRRNDQAAPVLEAARAVAEAAGDFRKASVAVHLQALLYRFSDPARALQLLDERSPLKGSGAPGPHVAQWFHYRGLLEQDRSDLSAAERLLFRALDVYSEIPDRAGQSEVYDSLANLLLRTGKVRPALEFARRSLALKEQTGDLYGQAISHGTIGRCHLLQANYAEAEQSFQRDLDLARQLNDPAGIGIMLNSLGDVALLRGDREAAARLYTDNLSRPDEGGPINAARAYLGLTWAHLASDRIDDAASAADALAARLTQMSRPGDLSAALDGVRGAIAGRRGQGAEGEAQLLRAIEVLRNRRADLDTLPLLYELRDLYQCQGKTAEAVRVMSGALDLLSECGADERVGDLEKWLRTASSPALIRLALERHFPNHLVESILAGNLTRKNAQAFTHRQTITVLFSDLRDYTTLSEGLEPEAVLDLLNEWFAEVTRIIRQHNGVVDKFIGDAVMALFGVPDPRPEAPADAVRAALAMRDALRARNLRHRALGGREIRIGIGIHTGEAVVGFLGSHLRRSYTAIGDTVNIASRLESATKDYAGCDILISQETNEAQRLQGVAETEARGLARIKGRSPVSVYEVLGRRQGEPAW